MPDNPPPASSACWLSLLSISGDDRVSFLQGQLTQDVSLLSNDRPTTLAASCDAKGRVLAVLTLMYTPDTLYAAIRHDLRDTWVAHVLRYRMRAKVDITDAQDIVLNANEPAAEGFDPRQPDGAAPLFDDGLPAWRFGQLGEALSRDHDPLLTNDRWRQLRLRAGVADVGPATSGAFTPHMLNLDRLGAISFRKGCYTGQEVVARTEHLGAVKRRAWLLQADGDAPLTEGATISADGRSAGRIAAASGNLAIAVLGNDYASAPLTLEDGRPLVRHA